MRALRNICCSKQSAQMAVENDRFPDLLACLTNTSLPQEARENTILLEDTDLLISCLKLMCELLKTQAIEVGFRLVEDSVLKSLFQLGDHSDREVQALILEIMFQLTVTTRCRVAVATEGAIELFLKHIRKYSASNCVAGSSTLKVGMCISNHYSIIHLTTLVFKQFKYILLYSASVPLKLSGKLNLRYEQKRFSTEVMKKSFC